jgi:endonuclease/exonuclease/phosphatase family metal-dependent hydrolase
VATLTQLRVATWNIHEAMPLTGTPTQARHAVIDEVVDQVCDNEIDILAMQEVEFDSDGTSSVLSALTRRTPLRHVRAFPISPSSFLTGHYAGLAIVSRFPIGHTERHKLPNPYLRTTHNGKEMRSHDKGFMVCAVPVGGRDMTVVSLHSFPFHRFGRRPEEPDFREVWETFARTLTTGFSTEYLVICGDFNTANRRLVTDLLNPRMTRAIGSTPTHRGMPIDDILLSPAFGAGTDAQIVDTFSDHHLCLADLTVR